MVGPGRDAGGEAEGCERDRARPSVGLAAAKLRPHRWVGRSSPLSCCPREPGCASVRCVMRSCPVHHGGCALESGARGRGNVEDWPTLASAGSAAGSRHLLGGHGFGLLLDVDQSTRLAKLSSGHALPASGLAGRTRSRLRTARQSLGGSPAVLAQDQGKSSQLVEIEGAASYCIEILTKESNFKVRRRTAGPRPRGKDRSNTSERGINRTRDRFSRQGTCTRRGQRSKCRSTSGRTRSSSRPPHSRSAAAGTRTAPGCRCSCSCRAPWPTA